MVVKNLLEKLLFAVTLTAMIIAASGCTKSSDSIHGNGAATANSNGPQKPEAATTSKGPQIHGETNIAISTIGETLMFDKHDLYVETGKEITLTFTNNASAMKHNWVMVTSGHESEVAMAGLRAGESKDFIPDSPYIITHTKLIAKGSQVIKFRAPKPGDYPFICTFAGHFTVMHGIVHVLEH